mmetsp:Transcript_3689/g.8073  ORF Transcript_3689/g.8073 Transcript_3689/m.8073 type:complete len:97 (+) Transcript_3689:1297-1587(+)
MQRSEQAWCCVRPQMSAKQTTPHWMASPYRAASARYHRKFYHDAAVSVPRGMFWGALAEECAADAFLEPTNDDLELQSACSAVVEPPFHLLRLFLV